MSLSSRLVSVALCLLFASAGRAADWTPPTPEELSMTSQPEVPGAAAVYLYRQENTRNLSQAASDSNASAVREDFCSTVEPQSPIVNPQPALDPKLNYQTLYVRLKVLTPEGVRYGKVVLDEPEPYWSALKVEGRTIQPDGSIVPFAGSVDRRMISKTRDMLRYVNSFQMPGVKVGSILEYRITVNYPEYLESPARWFIQQDLFVRKADYYYIPHTWVRKPEESNYGYTSNLPEGVKPMYRQSERSYSMQMANVMPFPGDFPPPPHSQGYRVVFHHTCFPTVADFWNTHGKWWSGDVDRFASASRLKSVAGELIAPGDTDPQKVEKLYAAVARLGNLSYGRSGALTENEAKEMKTGNAPEVWSRKEGSSQDLTMLFIGLARAAGLKATTMAVADRAQTIFDPKDVREEDVNDYVAVVSVDGKDMFLDPGEPFCPFGQLSWRHSLAGGIRQSDGGGTAFSATPASGYKQNQTQRMARLQLAADGSLTGAGSLTLAGQPALEWRQRALLDPIGIDEALAAEFGEYLPEGFSVKTTQVAGLTEPVTSATVPPLIVRVEVKGTIAPNAGEVRLSESLFEARSPQVFGAAKREVPVDLRYPSVSQDVVAITLPAGMKLKTTPPDAAIPLGETARLVIKHTAQDNLHTTARLMIHGQTIYSATEYPELKAFYAKVNAQDGQQVVAAP